MGDVKRSEDLVTGGGGVLEEDRRMWGVEAFRGVAICCFCRPVVEAAGSCSQASSLWTWTERFLCPCGWDAERRADTGRETLSVILLIILPFIQQLMLIKPLLFQKLFVVMHLSVTYHWFTVASSCLTSGHVVVKVMFHWSDAEARMCSKRLHAFKVLDLYIHSWIIHVFAGGWK